MKPLAVIDVDFSRCLGRLRGEESLVSRSWTRARLVRGCALNAESDQLLLPRSRAYRHVGDGLGAVDNVRVLNALGGESAQLSTRTMSACATSWGRSGSSRWTRRSVLSSATSS
jgi:hypothetical protein